MIPTHSALFRSLARPGKTFSLIGLGALLACSALPVHAQYADWNANPPKILPNERVAMGPAWATGSGRQCANENSFAALKSDGSVVTWGDPSTGGDSTSVTASLNSDVIALYSNPYAYAALKNNGSVVTWGYANAGGNSTSVAASLSSDVIAVHSTRYAFAALKGNGSVVTWGGTDWGGNSTIASRSGYASVAGSLSSDVEAIYSNHYAFVALKKNGSVVAWGSADGGGNATSMSASLSSGVKTVFSTALAFAALKDDGSVVTWGDATNGGNSGSVAASLTSDVTTIYSNAFAFAALKKDGSLVTWGNSAGGGNSSAVATSLSSDVINVYSTYSGFAALKRNGSVVTWGNPEQGGNSSIANFGVYTSVAESLTQDVIAVYSSTGAFAALKSDGSVVTWGDKYRGGDSSSVAASLSSGVTNVYSSAGAFAAVKADGSVVTWGDSSYGGNSNSVAARLSSGVITVYSNIYAFAALKRDGSVVVWGSPTRGGGSGPEGTDIASVQSVSYYDLGVSVSVSSETLTSSTASLFGEVTREGKTPVTARGFVYALATVADPKIGEPGVTQVTDSGSGLGSFSTALSGLSPNTAYVFKAYAIDEDGATYSPVAAFSTNLSPLISSNSGSSTASVSVAENSNSVTTVNATDADAGQTITYSITGGTDAARFVIGSSSGALTFVPVPDFEAPVDANADNIYQVIVTATDNGNTPKSATQTLTVTVTNESDSGEIAVEQPEGTNLTKGGTVMFGSVTVGQPKEIVFTVRSSGEVPLLLNGVEVSGANAGDFVLTSSLPSSIDIGGSATFTVRFTASTGGTLSAVLQLSSNDQSGGESPFVINLSGTGSTTSTLATYTTPTSQAFGGWVNNGNFTIGSPGNFGTVGNNWPAAEGPEKAVDGNAGVSGNTSKFLLFRNTNAGLILKPTNSSVVFNRMALYSGNDAPERDPTSYIIYGSNSALSGSAGTNIPISSLIKITEGTLTMLSARSAGPNIVQFANSTAYTSYVVVFPTVRSTVNNNCTQVSEVQLLQGMNPPFAVAMGDARGGELSGSTFNFGSIGTTNPGNNWPSFESPDHALDGNVNTKFLFYRPANGGIVCSPVAGPAAVNRFIVWTANDAPERDPIKYQVYGFATRVTQTGGSLNVGTAGTLLGSGNLTLPDARNAGPVTVEFTNSTAYASYLVVFPAVKYVPITSMMQIAEVQFGYNGVPEFALPAGVTTPAGETWTARASSAFWSCLASSADGSKLAAVANGSPIYTSTDSGVTWTARETSRSWVSIASSADGTKLVAVVAGGQIYTSNDSGVSWVAREINRYWSCVASSADGTKLIAGISVSGGNLYTSTDAGLTWTARESSRVWRAVASSADGTKLAAVANMGQIYTSTDSGLNWTARETNREWQSITSSADGTRLAAAAYNGHIYTSTDSGVSWTARESVRNWKSIASSADGSTLIAGINLFGAGNAVFTSSDAGATWTPRVVRGDTEQGYWGVAASSADGSKVMTGAAGGLIYTAAASTAIYELTVAEDSGSFTQTAFATGITPGIGDVGQTVSFAAANDNHPLFSTQPAISANGTLTFTPAADANGTATVTVTATDSTGLSSAPQAFILTVTAVADVPVLAAIPTSSAITSNTATLGGEIIASDFPLSGRGVVYSITSTNAAPQIGGTGVVKVGNSTLLGTFTVNAVSLTPDTTYSFRAFATSTAGTSYSEVRTFTTRPIPAVSPSLQTLRYTYGTAISPTAAFTTTGLDGPVTYTISPSASNLPAGLSLNPATGVITGRPTETWSFTRGCTVIARGAGGVTATAELRISVVKAPLSLVVNNKTRAYGAPNPAFSMTCYGLVNGDSPAVIGSVSYQTSATTTSAPGIYRVLLVYPPPSNYNVTGYWAGQLEITKAPQTITLAPLANSVPLKDLGSVNLTATSSTGLPVTLSLAAGSAATLSGTPGNYSLTDIGTTGIVTVLANQPGNANYAAAPQVVASFDVTKANQAITLAGLEDKTYGDAPVVLTGTSDSGLEVSYAIASGPAILSGNSLVLTGAGTVELRASQSGNNSYNAAPAVERSFVVAPKTLTVAGAAAADKVSDGSNVASISGAHLVGVINGDEVSLIHETDGIFSQTSAGTGLSVTPAMELAGADADNYTLIQPTLTATITAAEITHTHQEEWRFANFGSYASANSGADSADPDGDGLNNLLEYALGLDPNSSGVIPAALVLNGANLEYTYTRSTAAKDNGVTYRIEWSETLEAGSWSTETVSQQITSTQGALETVKASVPKSPGGKRFLRLRVSAPGGGQ